LIAVPFFLWAKVNASHLIACTVADKGYVLSMGSGSIGQLGHGPDKQDVTKPRRIETICAKPFSMVASGGLHSVAVTTSGQVYTWGNNDENALGRKSDEWLPDISDGLDGKVAVQVSAGDCHTCAVTQDGVLYAWGTFRNLNGPLGFSPNVDTQPVPTPVAGLPANTKIVSVASGANHVVALTEDGHVYQWGDVRVQQRVGPRFLKQQLVPKPILFGGRAGRVVAIFAAQYSSWAVAATGEIYAWGLNNFGQCGFGVLHNEDTFRLPARAPLLEALGPIAKITGGIHHTMVLTQAGKVYTFGKGTYGRLGHGDQSDKLLPTLVQDLVLADDPIVDIGAGTDHSLAVSSKGHLYGFGFNSLAQLGTGKSASGDIPEEVSRPYKVTSKHLRPALRVAGGAQHSLVLAAQPWDGPIDAMET